MASKTLAFVLTGIDQSASTTLGAIGVKGSSTADKISGSFSKMGSALGGEFGEIGEKLGSVFESMGEKGHSMGTKVAAAGAAIGAVGAILTNMGAADKQATDQLKQSIDATGQSYSDYSEEIEKTVKHEENYAHSAVDTQTALRTLTTATGSAKTALDDMNVVTNLAAARHISLNDAATLVAKVLGGTGTRTLAQYGISMAHTGDKTKDAQDALDALSKKIDGQANASMDNWGAKVDVVKTKVEDFAAKMGEKFGPAITAAGPALMLAGSAMQVMSNRSRTSATALEEHAVAAEADTVAMDEEAVASEEAGMSMAAAAGPLAVVAIAATALTVVWENNKRAAQENTAAIGRYEEQLKESGGAIDDTIIKSNAATLANKGIYDSLAKLGVSQNTVTQASLGNKAALEQVTNATKGHSIATKAAGMAVMAMAGQLSEAQAKEKQAADASTDATKTESFTLDKASVAYGTAANQTMAYDNALKGLTGSVLSAVKGEDQYLDSLDQVTAAVKQNGTSLDDNTTKGRANREAIENSIGSINDQVKAQRASGASITTVNNTLQTNINKLVDSATKAGLNKTQVKAMIAQMALTPSKIETQIIVDATAALSKLGSVEDKLNYIGGLAATDTTAFLSIASHVGTNVSGGTAANADRTYPHASGGTVSGNTFDEYGIEGLRLPNDTVVIPHGQTQQMMRGTATRGGDVHIHITVPTVVQPTQETMRAITTHLETWAEQGGAFNIGKAIR